MPVLGSLSEKFENSRADNALRLLLSAMAADQTAHPVSTDGIREKAERALRWRRIQRRIFPEAVLRGPCWDIMLTCITGELADQPVCVKQIRNQLDESQTSVLRRIDELEQAGMVQRFRDERDGRRTLVRLTWQGADAMSRFFIALDQPQ